VAREGTPNDGLDWITERIYFGSNLVLVAYTNAQESLGSETVAADLTQPTQANGYAPITLDGDWATDNGVVTYTHPPGADADELGNPAWFPTGAWSAPVTGVALVEGARVVHFMDHRDGDSNPTTWVAASGKVFPVDISTLAS
jgi:hypothetical protein